jgi:hypothetical protein
MQGHSLAAGCLVTTGADLSRQPDEEEIIRARLSGLGYIA